MNIEYLPKLPGGRALAAACLLLLSNPAFAATFVVNSTADPGDGV